MEEIPMSADGRRRNCGFARVANRRIFTTNRARPASLGDFARRCLSTTRVNSVRELIILDGRVDRTCMYDFITAGGGEGIAPTAPPA